MVHAPQGVPTEPGAPRTNSGAITPEEGGHLLLAPPLLPQRPQPGPFEAPSTLGPARPRLERALGYSLATQH